jgi:hypothetical protein
LGELDDDMADDDNAEERGRLALGRRLIANALQYSSAPVFQTAVLQNLKHDADLLPRIQRQIRILLDGFHRDTAVTYDIQGLHDYGCDILVRLQTGSATSYVGLQVKSHEELLDFSVVNKLTIQHVRANDRYAPMLDFYIVLAANLDEKGKHHAVIRGIHQEFSTRRGVHVVDPLYVATFLRLSPVAMDGLITRTMRTGDPVLASATSDLSRHPLHSAIILRLVVAMVEGRTWLSTNDLIADTWLQAVCETMPIARLMGTPFEQPHDRPYRHENDLREALALPMTSEEIEIQEWDDDDFDWWFHYSESGFFENISPDLLVHLLGVESPTSDSAAGRLAECLPEAFELLEDDLVVDTEHESNRVSIQIESHLALFALAAEGKVKHEFDSQELVDYVVQLVLRSS